jgi:uncharacterized membrane protein YkoI
MHRTPRTLPLLLALGVAFSLPAFAADNAVKDAKPGANATQDAKAQTKVSEADARKTALASVPNGTVQSSKLMTDKGRQVWAFDLKGESSPNVVAVQVDASSGRIVSKSIKSAAPAAAKAKKS